MNDGETKTVEIYPTATEEIAKHHMSEFLKELICKYSNGKTGNLGEDEIKALMLYYSSGEPKLIPTNEEILTFKNFMDKNNDGKSTVSKNTYTRTSCVCIS